MPLTVFYSWQADRPSSVNRSFIQGALDAAIRELNRELTLVEATRNEGISLDRDTQGVSGSPPIVDTILEKIAAASVFVPDLTYIAFTDRIAEEFIELLLGDEASVLCAETFAVNVVNAKEWNPVLDKLFFF